jgi:hypothetical protein
MEVKNMEIIIVLIIIFLIIFIFVPKNNKLPYKQKPLLTKTEYTFYKVLKSECDKYNIIICPKVRMEDFLSITDKTKYQKWRGHVKSRHIDFMLCDNNLNLIAGLELDDKSHNTSSAKETDGFKNDVFKSIGLPLFRIKTNSNYKNEIHNMLSNIK